MVVACCLFPGTRHPAEVQPASLFLYPPPCPLWAVSPWQVSTTCGHLSNPGAAASSNSILCCLLEVTAHMLRALCFGWALLPGLFIHGLSSVLKR